MKEASVRANESARKSRSNKHWFAITGLFMTLLSRGAAPHNVSSTIRCHSDQLTPINPLFRSCDKNGDENRYSTKFN